MPAHPQTPTSATDSPAPTAPAPGATFARTAAGTGPGVLLAHGAGGSTAANYGPVLDALTPTHRVVGVDYPGTGATPRSQTPLALDALADELVAAADAEGLESFALVGYSLGTAVALRAATRHPERVTALVLTAPFARPDTRTRLTAEVWRGLAASGDRDTLARFLLPLALSPAALASLSAADTEATVRGTAESIPEGSADHVDLVARVDVRADLARIAVPTLAIITTEDQLIPPALQREAAAGIAGARTADLATGHLPFAEQPAQWQRLISDFLDGQPAHRGGRK
ncbi:Putative aminoacrylate hydrolase RutD [Streptomyces sp. YIM 121038]|uniref:alpha/beta fold hydrolase n=1 Tax=Streptomyces sp. YIM 121038 TaxID=2136401 RepID=UPI001110840E|nr:alpha/beta fold hydrolase [Streptomyces sp. YIM 121038]QCX77981.1 Putative aminoacrylate hydrolase RutD [Streptomyces sp. YIM 121038]